MATPKKNLSRCRLGQSLRAVATGAAAGVTLPRKAWRAPEGGRRPSIWDTFSHIPRKVHANQTGDVADELLANGSELFCTLFNWDLPQALACGKYAGAAG